MTRFLLSTCLALGLATAAQAETTAIVHAHIVSMGTAGDIASGTLVIRDGRIAAIGADIAVPPGAKIVDAQGDFVTPGMTAAATALGAINFVLSPEQDDSSNAAKGLSAGFDSKGGFDPNTHFIAEARSEGVTSVVLTPTMSETVRGDGSAWRMLGGLANLMTLDDRGAHVVQGNLSESIALGGKGAAASGGSRGATLQLLGEAFDELRAPGGVQRLTARGLGPSDLQALRLVVAGQMPLLAEAHRESDIVAALDLAVRHHLRLIVLGAEEAWRVSARLAAAHVSVVLNPDIDAPTSMDNQGASFANAASLSRAGVTVVLQPSPAMREFLVRSPRFSAGLAVAYGLPWHEALAAITINPARVWGYSADKGSLEVGKAADLVIWHGDPLEARSWPSRIMIAGRLQSTDSRKLELERRYLDTPSAADRLYRPKAPSGGD